ncbi:hypothetical protein [Sphingorhabdus sp.]|jgi:hypothetical protein|uniref:hypothetical protein n=1 Tax=Sphingorhabdus sp. TaxID=1902408 RepID=UPI0037C75C46
MFMPLILIAAAATTVPDGAPARARVTASSSVTVIAAESISLSQLQRGQDRNRTDRRISRHAGGLSIEYY